MIAQEVTLKDFYRAVNNWVESDFKENPYRLNENIGLCMNLDDFLFWCYDWDTVTAYLLEEKLNNEMIISFKEAGLSELFPFDKNFKSYDDCENKYTNPLRVKWVKDHI